MELTLQQRQAIAIAQAKAKARAKAAQNTKLEEEVAAKAPVVKERMEGSVKVGGDPTLSPVPNGGNEPLHPQAPPLPEGRAPAGAKLPENIDRGFAPRMDHGIPATSPFADDPFEVPRGVAKGVWNAIPETLKTFGSAAGSTIGIGNVVNQDSPTKSSNVLFDAADKIPTFKPQSDAEKILIPMGEIGAGVVAGNKAGAAVKIGEKVAGMSGKLLRAGKSMIASDAGATAAMDKETDPFFLPEFEPQEGDSPEVTHAKKTVRLGLDNFLTTMAFGGAGKVAGAAGRYSGLVASRLKNWGNIPEIEKEFVSEILDMAAKIPDNATTDQVLQAKKELIDYMEKNGNKTVELGDNAIANPKIERDSTSTIFDTLDARKPKDAAKKISLEGMRSSSMKGGSPKLETALNAPRNTVENVLEDIQTTRGGSEAIDQTRQSIQREARDQADATRIEPELARQNLADEETGLKDTLLKDETFGDEFKKAQDAGVSLDIDKSSLDKQTEVLTKAKDAREINVEKRNTAFDKVGETGASAKMDEFSSVYEKNKEFVPTEIQNIIEKADGSFQYLNKEVRPALSKAIDRAYSIAEKTGDFSSVEGLRNIRDNITRDQMAHLTEQGSNQAAQAAIDANKQNIEYSKLHNQGIGKELKINEKINRPKGPGQDIDFKEKGRPIILNTIRDSNRRESVKQLQKILGPEDDHLVADIALAESFKEITGGKGDIAKITADLREMSAAFPDQQRRRIEGFLTDVGEKNKNIEYFKGKVKELEDAATTARDEIYQKNFKTMFKEAKGGEAIEKTNGYQAMKDIFKNTETDEFQHVLAAAKKDPESLSGLQAAWARNAEEILASNKQDVKQLEDHFKQYGKEIFGDTPMIKNVEELFEMSKNIAEQNKARMANPYEFAKNQTEAHGVVNQILTFAFGVLNPTSARIRTISNDLMKSHSSFNASKQAADNVLSSTSKFVEVARKVLKEGEKRLSPADRKIVFRTAVKMGIYGSRDQTEEVLQ